MVSGSEACCQDMCLPALPHQVAMFCRPRIQLRIPPALSLTGLQQGSIQKGTVNVRPQATSPQYSSPTPACLHPFIQAFTEHVPRTGGGTGELFHVRS